MKLWQSLVATLLAIILMSFIVTALWRSLFDAQLPSYIAGIVGGMTGVSVWSFLHKHRLKKKRDGDASGN